MKWSRTVIDGNVRLIYLSVATLERSVNGEIRRAVNTSALR